MILNDSPSQRQACVQKQQECQTLRTELSRLKVVATTLGTSTTSTSTSSASAAAAAASPESWAAVPAPPTTPPPPQIPYSSTTQSPLSRFHSVHARSASTSTSSRPTTPSPITRTHTPTPITRAYTSAPVRSHTPASPMRHATPAPSPLHSTTPAPPPVPPKPRRLSEATPPLKMTRSASEEKQEIHERWIPPQADDYKSSKYASSSRPPSRASYSIASNPRYRDIWSPSPA